MLAQKFRLKKTDGIAYILTQGKTLKNALFIIKYRNNQKNHHRFSIITSYRFAKQATARNKTRRKIYEAIRLSTEKNNHEKYFDIVIIPKKRILETDFSSIQHHIDLPLKTLQ